MKNKKHLAFFGAVILFVAVLGSGVFIQENLRRNGQQVILATLPVDPRDILRGDYVDLAYEIGRGEKAVAFAKTLRVSQPIYTLLTLGEDNRVISYDFSTEKPKSGVYIRGEGVVYEDDFVTDAQTDTSPTMQGTIHYPQIEQYFVPEGKGWAIDRMGWAESGKTIEVKIALRHGRAQILQLLVDGKPLDFSQIEAENPWTDEPVKVEPEPEPAVPVEEKI